MRRLLLVLGFLLLASPAWAACSGSSPNLTAPTWADVAACWSAAVNGDTITVSAGTYTTSSAGGISFTSAKYVTLKCAPGVTINDDMAAASTPLTIAENTTGSYRLQDCAFVKQPGANHVPPNALTVVNSTASGKPVLVTGNSYDYTSGGSGTWFLFNTVRGLLWLNQMTGAPSGSNCNNGASFVRQKPTGATWSSLPTYGSADTDGMHNFYMEDNTLSDVWEATDFSDSARAVARFNNVSNGNVGNHGADTSAFGDRYQELYWNTFTYDGSTKSLCTSGTKVANVTSFMSWRGGTGIAFQNAVPDIGNVPVWGAKTEIVLFYEQLRRSAGPFFCYANQGSTIYPAPKEPGWGYSVGAFTVGGGPTDCNGGACGATAIQDLEPVYFMANSGASPNVTGVGISNYQGNDCGASVGSASTYVQANREVYNQTSLTANSGPSSGPTPFTGSTGTGYGPIASRPDSCTAGVAYWATDQGNWNTTVAPNTSGKMYLCTATNTWVAQYGANNTGELHPGEPYTYPHPMRGAVTPPGPGAGRFRIRF